jgi:hypothetical protein
MSVNGNHMNHGSNNNAYHTNNNNNNVNVGMQHLAAWTASVDEVTNTINQLRNTYIANPPADWRDLLAQTRQNIAKLEDDYPDIRDGLFAKPEQIEIVDAKMGVFQDIKNGFEAWLNANGLVQNGGKRKNKKTRKSKKSKKSKKRRSTAKGKVSK